jgi:hypothetical protein
MCRNLVYLVIGTIILSGCISIHSTERVKDKPADAAASTPDVITSKKPAQVLRHVVLFRFKDGTTSQQIKEAENAFCSLPSKISAIHDFEWGPNVSIEDHSDGFTHCFMLTFLSEADRNQYLPHPAHKELGSILQPYLDKVLVVDYWAKP